MAQQVENLGLSLLWHGLNPWLWNFCTPWALPPPPKKKRVSFFSDSCLFPPKVEIRMKALTSHAGERSRSLGGVVVVPCLFQAV